MLRGIPKIKEKLHLGNWLLNKGDTKTGNPKFIMAWLVNPAYTIFLIVNKTSSLPFSTSNHTNPHSKYNYHWCHCLATCLINCQHWWLTWQTQFAASCHWRRHCHVNFLSPSIINHLKNCSCIHLSNWQWQILRQKTLVLNTFQRPLTSEECIIPTG